jgi:phosphoribosylamine--glycine ligase
MGAYAPVSLGVTGHAPGAEAAHALELTVINQIMLPALDALRERGARFSGLLYAGIMLTASGPKVVEFNCRFGDPETQAILPIVELRLLELLRTVASGGRLPTVTTYDVVGHAVTTVVAAAGYPEQPRTGDAITLPPPEEGVHVFHAGTARAADGTLVTAGGRVLAVTAVADTFAEAQRRSADYAQRVEFAGKQFRTDVGWRELRRAQAREVHRHAGAS